MQIFLEHLVKMASGEFVLTAEELVPLPNVAWKYFGFIANASKKIKDKKRVFCKLCDPPFSLSYSTNTSNLTYHLERKHPEDHRKVITAQGKTKAAQAPSKMLSTAAPFLSINDSKHGGVKPYDKSSRRAKQLVNATAQFISLSLQPIRVVDEPSFSLQRILGLSCLTEHTSAQK